MMSPTYNRSCTLMDMTSTTNTTTNTMTTRSGRMAIVTSTTMIEPREVYGVTVDRVIVETRTFDSEYTSTFHHLSNGTQFIFISTADYESIINQ